METGKEVAVSNQSIMLGPQDVVNNATLQAKLLMDIVTKTKCFQVISGKRYLQVEAWETIGAFNRVHAVTESLTPIMVDGAVVGYDAKVSLLNIDGICVGAAIMPSYFTENACKGKEGDAKDKACKSAAQTFAESKAYRMNYSYVAILAGYEPTPAEEMTGTEAAHDEVGHFCTVHNTPFFLKGKMKSYAHPIGDTGEWCHEHIPEPTPTKPPASPPPAKAPGTQKVQDDAVKVRQAPPASKPVSGTTAKLPAGLEKDLKTLAPKITGYQREHLIPYLDELSGNLGSESITSAYNKLTEEQQVEFTAQVAADVKLV